MWTQKRESPLYIVIDIYIYLKLEESNDTLTVIVMKNLNDILDLKMIFINIK